MMMIKQANKLVFEAVFNGNLVVLRYLLSEKTEIMKKILTYNNNPRFKRRKNSVPSLSKAVGS